MCKKNEIMCKIETRQWEGMKKNGKGKGNQKNERKDEKLKMNKTGLQTLSKPFFVFKRVVCC